MCVCVCVFVYKTRNLEIDKYNKFFSFTQEKKN